MVCNYLVTAHRATAVTSCATGSFTSSSELNIVIAQNNHISISVVTPQGLKLVKEFKINGSVEVMKLFRPRNLKKDRLFIVTARHNAMILECSGSGASLEILTCAFGNVGDRIGKKSEIGTLAVIDPESRMIGLRIYDSLFKIIPLQNEQSELTAFNIRMEEMQVCDIEFLYGCAQPTIVLLHQDVHGRHVITHEISLKEKDFVKVTWKQDNVGPHANMLIAVPQPLGGCIVIGADSIVYHNGSTYQAIASPKMQSSSVSTYARVDPDGSRYLLGDMAGHLFMLLLIKESSGVVKDLNLELMGETTISECMTYLDRGYVYIGSRLGDSQLIRLNVEPDENSSYVTVIENFTNLGPIVDMVVVDLERQGQGQLVTCSGGYKEGSLRIIRNGIGINELATLDLCGIKGMWTLYCGVVEGATDFENTMVMSFVEHTRVLTLNGDEVEETDIEGFAQDEMTFYTGNVAYHQLIQVTPSSIRLVSAYSKRLLCEWKPSTFIDRPISVVGCNSNQIVAACGSTVFYITIKKSGVLALIAKTTLDHEVACIDVSPYRETEGDTESQIVSLGLWNDYSVRILSLPSLDEVCKEILGGEIIPRSILMTQFGVVNYLLCAMGDGALYYFVINSQGNLSSKKKVILGTQPTVLRKFKSRSTSNVFACSDRPTVIYSSATDKLVFSNVNLREVKHMCPLNVEAYPDSLALATDSTVVIGTIDEIQKLHIRTIPLGETPRRICYQEQTQTFGVITMRYDIQGKDGMKPSRSSASTNTISMSRSSSVVSLCPRTNSSASTNQQEYGQEQEVYSLLIVDQNTFEVLHSHQLMHQEYALSIASCKLGEDPASYYIVGTGLVNPDESEPRSGRIIVFQWKDYKLNQIDEKEIKGACYSVCSFNNKLLVAINSTVRLWHWTAEKVLRLECSYFNNIIALLLKTRGDFILVGDLVRSMTLLQYKSMEGSLEETARHYAPAWMTAVEFVDNDTFLGAENSSNIFVCQRDSASSSEDERQQMAEVGQIYVGDMINVFRHGSLVMQNLGDQSTPHTGSILYATVLGAIGMVTQLPSSFYEYLNDLQASLRRVVKTVGKVDNEFWRSFCNDRKTEDMEGFIDGDLIETFLELSRTNMEEVCKQMIKNIDTSTGITKMDGTASKVEDVIKIVEDLTRIH